MADFDHYRSLYLPDDLSPIQRLSAGQKDQAQDYISDMLYNVSSIDQYVSYLAVPAASLRKAFADRNADEYRQKAEVPLKLAADNLSEIHNLYKLSLLRIRIFTEMDGAPRKQFGIARLTKAYNKIMKMLSGLIDADK